MSTEPARATVVISFDLELAWGSIENGSWNKLQRRGVFQRTGACVRQLLDTMDRFQIPATWAVVGGVTQPFRRYELDHLPATLAGPLQAALETADPRSFDGRDIIDDIAARPSQQRIGCHTYAHLRFQHPSVDAEIVDADLRRFNETIPRGLPISKLLVFPCNHEAYYEAVLANGFRVCRGALRGSQNTQWAKIRRMVSCPPFSERSEVLPGLTRVTDSLLFNSGPGRRHHLPFVLRRAMLGLRRAIHDGQTLHVWTHPFNFAESRGLLRSFEIWLKEVARQRDQGRVQVDAV